MVDKIQLKTACLVCENPKFALQNFQGRKRQGTNEKKKEEERKEKSKKEYVEVWDVDIG